VLSRLDNLANDSGGTTKYAQYTYLGGGAVVKAAHPAVTNGLDLTYKGASSGAYTGLDRFGRVVDQRWQNSAPTVMDQFKYGYNRASNRTWREVAPDGGNPTGFDEYYTYDGLQRLTRAARGTLSGTPYSGVTSPVKTQDFGLEALGNWKTFKEDDDATLDWDVLDQSRTHNPVNEMTGITGGSWIVPAYDAAGNMIRAPRPGQESTASEALLTVYDAWNRAAKVYKDSNQNGTLDVGTDALVAEYRYDGLNHRIIKLVPNVNNWDRTDFYYNEAWQCLEERYGANQAKETLPTSAKIQWLWSVQYIDAPVLRWRDTDANGTLDETLYYCNDANMNITALINTDGSVAERYVYDPYGKVTIYDDDWSDTVSWANSKQNEILYCGYRFDNESGLYSVRHRYYHPTLGRWTSRDGWYWDGMNLYEYVHGQPPNMVDPSGLWVSSIHKKITEDALNSFAQYATRLDPGFKKSFVDGNVNTDYGGYPNSAWLTVGFNAMEATKHYMVGYDELGKPDLSLMRQNARAAAETRIEFYKGFATILWRMGKEQKKVGNKQMGNDLCNKGWDRLGTALHTIQDKFSHTNKDWLPLLSWEHGGTLGAADPGSGPVATNVGFGVLMGAAPEAAIAVGAYQAFKWVGKDWLNNRRTQALTGTKFELGGLIKEADGPKECNCIEK